MSLVMLSSIAGVSRSYGEDIGAYKIVKESVPRILLIVAGPLAAVADIFDNLSDIAIKVPFTISYVVIGWVPIPNGDGTYRKLGEEFNNTYKFPAHYASLKSITFCFIAIVAVPLYAFYNPVKCSHFILQQSAARKNYPSQKKVVEDNPAVKPPPAPKFKVKDKEYKPLSKDVLKAQAKKLTHVKVKEPSESDNIKFARDIFKKSRNLKNVSPEEVNLYRKAIEERKKTRLIELQKYKPDNLDEFIFDLNKYPESFRQIYYTQHKLLTLSNKRPTEHFKKLFITCDEEMDEFFANAYWEAVSMETNETNEDEDENQENVFDHKVLPETMARGIAANPAIRGPGSPQKKWQKRKSDSYRNFKVVTRDRQQRRDGTYVVPGAQGVPKVRVAPLKAKTQQSEIVDAMESSQAMRKAKALESPSDNLSLANLEKDFAEWRVWEDEDALLNQRLVNQFFDNKFESYADENLETFRNGFKDQFEQLHEKEKAETGLKISYLFSKHDLSLAELHHHLKLTGNLDHFQWDSLFDCASVCLQSRSNH